MPLRILELGKQFRPKTSIIYPPFKNGRYMEEYCYDYFTKNKDKIDTDYVYIPIFWTNLQNHPGFKAQKQNYEILLTAAMKTYPSDTEFFTIVQHDDGPQLKMTGDVLVFGACTGSLPLPLIYEDTTNRLLNTPRPTTKKYLASFVGSITHGIRMDMKEVLVGKPDIYLGIQEKWSSTVPENLAETFIDITLQSKFCLAPRGYGRSSFRFFEALLLDVVPVYFWDDVKWLPYGIDYSKFSVLIKKDDIPRTYEILKSISDEKYQSMLEEIKRVRHYFQLDGMCEYIKQTIEKDA